MNEEWVSIDFETANWWRGSACAVGMSLVAGGRIVDRFSTYIKPPGDGGFDAFNSSLHGITAETVRDAPEWPEAWERMVSFIGGRTVVAHNAAFDLGVVRNACTETSLPWPELRYACTLVASRMTWRLLTYRLPYVAEAAGVALEQHHDAQADADAAAGIMLAALRLNGVAGLADLNTALGLRFGRLGTDSWSGAQKIYSGAGKGRESIPVANADANLDGMLYGLRVCLTGALATMTRSEAFERLARVGGQAVAGVTKKTDVLVLGAQARSASDVNVSRKQLKARELLDQGHDIEVIDEQDFLERLDS